MSYVSCTNCSESPAEDNGYGTLCKACTARVLSARAALDAFAAFQHESIGTDTVTDLIANLMHYLDADPIVEFPDAHARALMHYRAEHFGTLADAERTMNDQRERAALGDPRDAVVDAARELIDLVKTPSSERWQMIQPAYRLELALAAAHDGDGTTSHAPDCTQRLHPMAGCSCR